MDACMWQTGAGVPSGSVMLCIRLRCRLYDAVVKPVLSYGCEVWMPLISSSSLDELEKVHLSFLHRLLDVPRSAASKQMYAETGRLPQSVARRQQSLKYLLI